MSLYLVSPTSANHSHEKRPLTPGYVKNKPAQTVKNTAISQNNRQVHSKSYGVFKIIFGWTVDFWQKVISVQDGPTCPMDPVCSRYGRQAFQKHGALTGTLLTADRLIRCNGSRSGYDPVPE